MLCCGERIFDEAFAIDVENYPLYMMLHSIFVEADKLLDKPGWHYHKFE